MSGGGEWGAKASLLSLDPQTSYGVESEEDELERFMRSFKGEDSADGAIIRPGEYVRFFVEGDSVAEPLDAPQDPASVPVATFGVGEFSKEDHVPQPVQDASQAQHDLVRALPNHFGAFSAEGLYLHVQGGRSDDQMNATKVNAPGTEVGHFVSSAATHSASGGVDQSAGRDGG